MSYDSSNDRCNGCGHAEHACRCGVGENSIWFGGDDVDVRLVDARLARELPKDPKEKKALLKKKGAVVWAGTGVKWVTFDDMTKLELESCKSIEGLNKLQEHYAHKLGGT